jgi:hypothetical protein
MHSTELYNQFDKFKILLSGFDGGELLLGFLFYLFLVFLLFSSPVVIGVVRGKGFIHAAESTGRAFLYLALAMFPFTFPLGWIGLYGEIREALS